MPKQYQKYLGGFMKSLTKRVGALALVFAILLTLIIGSGLIIDSIVFAETVEDHCNKYFYKNLSINPMAEKFYNAFETLYKNGEFTKGTIQYDLIANDVATKEQAATYVSGNSDWLARSFGAGRDAFFMDHPDLFYADVFGTSISAGRDKSGEYVAYLDSSRVLTTYLGNLDSEKKVNQAIAQYESAIAAIVNGAKGKDVVEQIKYVNNYLVENVAYGYGTKVENGKNVDTDNAPFVYSAYGALVNHESVCEGYAKAFKAVMDRLDIPCVVVAGYVNNPDKGGYQPHAWNYVQVEGYWYMVDTTNNSSANNNKWVLVGLAAMGADYLEDNVVSTSGYELRYPAVKPYEYGNNTDSNGMFVAGIYDETDGIGTLQLEVSYENKGALVLQQEGKYLAIRYGLGDGKGSIDWQPWMNVLVMNEKMKDNVEGDFFVTTDTSTIATQLWYEYFQFALINRAPDSAVDDIFMGDALVSYKQLTDADFDVQPTTPYRNDMYGSHEPAPGAVGVYPNNAGDLAVDKTHEIKLVYNDKLQLANDATINDIGMEFVVAREDELAHEQAVLTDFNWDGDKTITFKFTPSKMYIHNKARYSFTPKNLVGEKSQKPCFPVSFTFAGETIICNKILPGGQLYMSIYGQPQILDNSDLSVTNFQDENGNYFAASQRSQLMLVAEKKAPTSQMDNLLKDEMKVQPGEVVSSSTYELNLQICGLIPKILNGTYMQLSFGFPEGYDPNDEGTTFKVYHYKTDNKGNIIGVEEVPLIINQYGLIAKVDSFSPFTVVQLKKTSEAAKGGKSYIYASVNGGNGGTVTTDGHSGISEVTGDSITYDIAADKGYAIGVVKLNGKVVDAKNYANGKLTLAKSDIGANSMLEVTFVNEKMARAYASKGLSIYDVPAKSNVAGIVIGIVVAIVVLAGAGFAAWWFLIKNKKQPAKATASASKKPAAKKTSTAKSTATAKTTAQPSAPKKTAANKSTAATTAKTSASKPAAKSTSDKAKTAKPKTTDAKKK